MEITRISRVGNSCNYCDCKEHAKVTRIRTDSYSSRICDRCIFKLVIGFV
jgi:hypothetical protein